MQVRRPGFPQCSEETQALVRAMESRVEQVGLDFKVTLDIRDLMEYNRGTPS